MLLYLKLFRLRFLDLDLLRFFRGLKLLENQ